MTKKYTKYYDCRIYAIYYYEDDTIYYNLNFCAETQLIVYKGSAGSEIFDYLYQNENALANLVNEDRSL